MENEIPICGDCWLAVFNLVAPRQLGLEIALLSHRFDFYVDLHFRTRKWTLGLIKICHMQKEGGGTTTEMQIFNSENKLLPIPNRQLPNKVIGFDGLHIFFVGEKVVDFLLHFRRLLATCATSLTIANTNDHVLEFVVRNIWPIVKDNKACDHVMMDNVFQRLRQFAPSLLSDWPSLRIVDSTDGEIRTTEEPFPAFPPDDSANASDGQVLAKWLFTPRPDGVPKVFQCETLEWKTKIEGIKTAFVNASTPVNFIFVFWDTSSDNDTAGEKFFELTNKLTGERLVLKRQDKEEDDELFDIDSYYLCRCPLLRDEKQWAKWEKEATELLAMNFVVEDSNQWNKIGIYVHE